eukprot:6300698-Pyramimonas_sp.AAC.1
MPSVGLTRKLSPLLGHSAPCDRMVSSECFKLRADLKIPHRLRAKSSGERRVVLAHGDEGPRRGRARKMRHQTRL